MTNGSISLKLLFIFYMTIQVGLVISFYFTLQVHSINFSFVSYWLKGFLVDCAITAPISFFCIPLVSKLTNYTKANIVKNTNIAELSNTALRLIFIVYMSALLGFCVSFVVTIIKYSINVNFVYHWFSNFLPIFVATAIVAFFFGSTATKLTKITHALLIKTKYNNK